MRSAFGIRYAVPRDLVAGRSEIFDEFADDPAGVVTPDWSLKPLVQNLDNVRWAIGALVTCPFEDFIDMVAPKFTVEEMAYLYEEMKALRCAYADRLFGIITRRCMDCLDLADKTADPSYETLFGSFERLYRHAQDQRLQEMMSEMLYMAYHTPYLHVDEADYKQKLHEAMGVILRCRVNIEIVDFHRLAYTPGHWDEPLPEDIQQLFHSYLFERDCNMESRTKAVFPSCIDFGFFRTNALLTRSFLDSQLVRNVVAELGRVRASDVVSRIGTEAEETRSDALTDMCMLMSKVTATCQMDRQQPAMQGEIGRLLAEMGACVDDSFLACLRNGGYPNGDHEFTMGHMNDTASGIHSNSDIRYGRISTRGEAVIAFGDPFTGFSTCEWFENKLHSMAVTRQTQWRTLQHLSLLVTVLYPGVDEDQGVDGRPHHWDYDAESLEAKRLSSVFCKATQAFILLKTVRSVCFEEEDMQAVQ